MSIVLLPTTTLTDFWLLIIIAGVDCGLALVNVCYLLSFTLMSYHKSLSNLFEREVWQSATLKLTNFANSLLRQIRFCLPQSG